MLDNRAIIGFVVIVLIGLGLAVYISGKSNPSTSRVADVGVLDSPTPQITIPEMKETTPIPSIAPISATQGVIKTAKGDIEFMLYPNDAPKTVTNFATLAKSGYYNNNSFHRVESWVIQGGDPEGTGAGGQSIYGATFEDEIDPNSELYQTGYVEGTLAMANRGPNTNGSQFFIIKKDTPLDPAYTIFGKVTSGMDVVNQITPGTKILGIDVQ